MSRSEPGFAAGETMVERRTRQAAKRETREALIDAALAEFSAHGVEAPSLDAICARAGFTRGAFYVHFRDREDLVVAVFERAVRSFIDAMIPTGPGGDLAATVGRFADAIAQVRAGGRAPAGPGPVPALPFAALPFVRLLEGVARSARLRERLVGLMRLAIERLAEAVAQGQAAGLVAPGVEPGQVGLLLAALAIGLLVAQDVGLPIEVDAAHRAALQVLLARSPGPPG